MKKKKRLKPWVYDSMLILFLSLLLAALLTIGIWLYDNLKTKKIEKSLEEEIPVQEVIEDGNETQIEQINPPEDKANDYWDYIKTPLISVDFAELLKKNSDTVAWIQVQGTNINYPVVQTNNNEYYLTHAFDKTKNSAGWVYSDYRNDWKELKENTIIYGHGRWDKTVFGTLKNTLKSSWQEKKENHIVRISTPTENTLWQVFSIYQEDAESYYLTSSFQTEEAYQTFLDTMIKRSIYPFSTTLNTKDKIITLSTCAEDNEHRIVLHAKLIKKETRKKE